MSAGYWKVELLRLMYQNEIIGASPKIELWYVDEYATPPVNNLVKTYTSPSCTRTNLSNGVRITCTVEDTSTSNLVFNEIAFKRTAWATNKDEIAGYYNTGGWTKAPDQKLTITITLDLTGSVY